MSDPHRTPDRETHDPRSAGRLKVLETIRQASAIARIDISKHTGLSPATVTALTAELLQAGLIEPVATIADISSAKRGRPRAALKLRAASKLIAGIKVGKEVITVLLLDFEGREIGHDESPLPASSLSADDLCGRIVKAAAQACSKHGYAPNDLSGMGIGLAGQVNGSDGFVHWSSSLHERNVPLATALARRAPCPVFIENDANLVAKAEQLFGEGRGVANFVVVTIEHGIGMGIVIDSKLYRGARGCGAEFGHTKVARNGEACQCGQLGCLEAYAGEYALVKLGKAAGVAPCTDIDALISACKTGDPALTDALAPARQFFALGLANLINLFDPELMILASKNGADHPLCAAAVLADLRDMVLKVDTPMPRISLHGWGDLMWAKGAAAYGLERVTALAVRQIGNDAPDRQTAASRNAG